MAFILKDSFSTINIKLTTVGRKQLAEGKLSFKKWAIGDSEINYALNTTNSFDPFDSDILRPKDKNPEIISFIKQTPSADTANTLSTISSIENVLVNTANERGFFEKPTSNFSILADTDHVVQADIEIDIDDVDGGVLLPIKQSSNFLQNPVEPIIGDFLLVNWANPLVAGGTVGNEINKATPYIWYKIEDLTGSLAADSLVVTTDKPLPNFDNQGAGKISSVWVYPNNNNGSSVQTYYGSPFVLDFVNDSVITFLENCNSPNIDVGVWNMSIIWTENIVGIKIGDRNISGFTSSTKAGFVQYIQQLNPEIKNIGVIHYTNNSPSNNYGEGLNAKSPILELPTVMWHYETGNSMGLTLSAFGLAKELPNLKTKYYDLADPLGNIVGKIFNDLKIFVIEDQELLFTMSYKSNRNWTLPPLVGGFNLGLCLPDIFECLVGFVGNPTFTNPQTLGALDGTITVNISGASELVNIEYTLDNGDPQLGNIFPGLGAGDYNVRVTDNGAINCSIETTVTLSNPICNVDVIGVSVS